MTALLNAIPPNWLDAIELLLLVVLVPIGVSALAILIAERWQRHRRG